MSEEYFVDVVLNFFAPTFTCVVDLCGAKMERDLGTLAPPGTSWDAIIEGFEQRKAVCAEELLKVSEGSEEGIGFELARKCFLEFAEMFSQGQGNRDVLKEILRFEEICGEIDFEEREGSDEPN